MASYTIELDSTRIPVYEEGSGEAVLLLHGYMGSHLSWRHQFDTLARSYRTVAVDWLGWGDSEKNPKLDYSLEAEVDRLRRLIGELGLRPLHLVGQDYGGLLTLAYAQKHREDLLDIILMNTKAHSTFRRRWYTLFKSMHLMGRLPGSRWVYRAMPLAAVHRAITRKEQHEGILSPEVVEQYCGWMKRVDGSEYLAKFFEDYRAEANEELARGLPQMTTETLILWGVKDRFLDEKIAHELASCIPNAELKIYSEAGHFVPEEAPEDVLRDMLAFLQRKNPRAFDQRPVPRAVQKPPESVISKSGQTLPAVPVSAGGRIPGR